MDYPYTRREHALHEPVVYDFTDVKSRRALCLLLARVSNRIRSQICSHCSWKSDLKLLDQVDIRALWNQAPDVEIVLPEINSHLFGDLLRKYWEDLIATDISDGDNATLEDYVWTKIMSNSQVLEGSHVYPILVNRLRMDVIRDEDIVKDLYSYLITSVVTSKDTQEFFSQAWTIIRNYLSDATKEIVYRPLLQDFWKLYEDLKIQWVERHELLYQTLLTYYGLMSNSNFQPLYEAVIEVFKTSFIGYL